MTVGITRAHLEEDAGKSTHPSGKDYSLVDLNRAGTPLLEIVSEPDMHNSKEAKAYARELYLRMRYAGVSDCNMYFGNMRFDVNVSVSNNYKLGIRTETKNLNSFRSIEKAVDYEIKRQIDLLRKGHKITQETRGWDDAKQKTVSQRSKENADDYRYMPDPDLPPIVLDDRYISSIKTEMPVMPEEWRTRLISLGMDNAQTETLLDAHINIPDAGYLDVIESVLLNKPLAIQIANWIVNVDIPLSRGRENTTKKRNRNTLYTKLYDLVISNKINSTNAKLLIIQQLKSRQTSTNIEAYAEQAGLIQVSGEDEIAAIVSQVISSNPKAVTDIKNGEDKAIGFLVGQVMKLSKGQANPSVAQSIINKQLKL